MTWILMIRLYIYRRTVTKGFPPKNVYANVSCLPFGCWSSLPSHVDAKGRRYQSLPGRQVPRPREQLWDARSRIFLSVNVENALIHYGLRIASLSKSPDWSPSTGCSIGIIIMLVPSGWEWSTFYFIPMQTDL